MSDEQEAVMVVMTRTDLTLLANTFPYLAIRPTESGVHFLSLTRECSYIPIVKTTVKMEDW